MSSPALPESPLMTMLLHRCGLDERAFGSLHGVEAAAWDAIVDHTESDVLRQVLASIRAELPMQGELPAPALRLLGAIATARTAGVPGDVLASFTDDALRTALHGRPVLHARVLDLDDREWRSRLAGSGTTGAPR